MIRSEISHKWIVDAELAMNSRTGRRRYSLAPRILSGPSSVKSAIRAFLTKLWIQKLRKAESHQFLVLKFSFLKKTLANFITPPHDPAEDIDSFLHSLRTRWPVLEPLHGLGLTISSDYLSLKDLDDYIFTIMWEIFDSPALQAVLCNDTPRDLLILFRSAALYQANLESVGSWISVHNLIFTNFSNRIN